MKVLRPPTKGGLDKVSNPIPPACAGCYSGLRPAAFCSVGFSGGSKTRPYLLRKLQWLAKKDWCGGRFLYSAVGFNRHSKLWCTIQSSLNL